MTSYRLNEQKHGVEITFSAKPSDATRAELKGAGFRWNKAGGYWYAVQSPERLALAQRLAGSALSAPAAGSAKTTQDHVKIYYNGLRIDGGRLIKCFYSLDNNAEHRPEVTIYADTCNHLPRDLFEVHNDTDIYIDYFDDDRARITPEHPLYKYIRYNAEKAQARQDRKYIESLRERLNGRERWPGQLDTLRQDLERREAFIAKFEAQTDPGQPTQEDLDEINRQRQEEENARIQAEHDEELRLREKALNDRAEGRRLLREAMDADPLTEGEPYVLIHWSEHSAFCDYRDDELKMSLKAANKVLGVLDKKSVNDPDVGYYKTKFTIYALGTEYTGRYDLGDDEGDLIGHIENLAEYDRTHFCGGQLIPTPPEDTERTIYAKKLRALVA